MRVIKHGRKYEVEHTCRWCECVYGFIPQDVTLTKTVDTFSNFITTFKTITCPECGRQEFIGIVGETR